MDFKRISFIFLITFFFLNIFLIYSYTQGENNSKSLADVGRLENLERRLTEEKIKFESNFSDETTDAYYLSGVLTNFSINQTEKPNNAKVVNGTVLNRDLTNGKEYIFSKENLIQDATDFVAKSEQIEFGQEYTYVEALNHKKDTLIYSQSYKKIPFFPDSSSLVIGYASSGDDEKKLISSSQTHIEEIEELREKQTVISEHDAIVTLYLNNKIPAGSSIKQTALVYTQIYKVNDKNIYIPTWVVWIETDISSTVQIEKVNGFSDSIISASVSDVRKD